MREADEGLGRMNGAKNSTKGDGELMHLLHRTWALGGIVRPPQLGHEKHSHANIASITTRKK
eukprot:714597-Pleurochrysis_carterae.AAC.1